MCLFFFFFFKQKTAYEMRISDWSSDVCSSDLLDDDGVFASAAKVARIAGELVVGYLGVQIAEAQVDDPVGIGTHHAFDLDAIDIGADIVVDRGAGDNLAELKILIFIIESGCVELQRAVAEAVL